MQIIVNKPCFNSELIGRAVLVSGKMPNGFGKCYEEKIPFLVAEVIGEYIYLINSNGHKYSFTIEDVNNGLKIEVIE